MTRIVTVVRAEHRRFWRREFGGSAGPNVVVQPRDRGTAAGILLPLLRIMARDPQAVVTLMPSDHFVADVPPFVNVLRAAQAAVERVPARAVLVGIEPGEPDGDYGWIVPGRKRIATRSVGRFVEKPDEAEAARLMNCGAVWNSFLLVARGWTILDMFDRRLPGYVDAFLNMRAAHSSRGIAELYRRIGPADFCRDVLQGSEASLSLLVAPPCGWTDLGTPSRLGACVEELRRGGADCPAGSLGAAFTARLARSVGLPNANGRGHLRRG